MKGDLTPPRRLKWAGCSGSIEKTDPTPEFAARREIEEETQLTSDDITLYRTGKAFKLVDTNLDITWIIHTFSFLLNDPTKKLVIEGEHTEYKFIKPEELGEYDHVSALEEGMKRVLPGPAVTKGLDRLRDDHDNGAEVLAMAALSTLKEVVYSEDSKSATTAEEFWKELRLAAWTLAKNGRPDMGPAIEGALCKALLAITSEIEKRGGSCFSENGLHRLTLEVMKEAAADGITSTIEARDTRMYALSASFVDFGTSSEVYQWRKGSDKPLNILTLSYSSSVTKALKQLIAIAAEDGTHIHLKILESRPRFDGVAFVKALFRERMSEREDFLEHLRVDVLSDAAVALAARQCDFVVIGSDKLSVDGDVSNKIGSLPACLLAKTLQPKSQVVVIATTDKITSSTGEELEEEPRDYAAEEMTGSYPKEMAKVLKEKDAGLQGAKVRVRNPYFEWVPSNWVDVYVTEEGVMDRSKLKDYAKEKRELEEKLFSDV